MREPIVDVTRAAMHETALDGETSAIKDLYLSIRTSHKTIAELEAELDISG